METNQSPTIAKLAVALAKVQAVMAPALKDSENPFFKSKYADLSSVWDVCRKPLTDNGLAVVQVTEETDGTVIKLCSTLVHESGEFIRSVLCMRPVKLDPQSVGSCLTYMRRYSLSALVGVCTGDDDGNSASGNHAPAGPAGVDAKTAAAKARYKSDQGAMGSAAPKPIPPPVTPPANRAVAQGVLISATPPNTGGYVSYLMEGQQREDGKDMKFATKDAGIIRQLNLALESKTEVALEYQPPSNPRFACSITKLLD